MKTPPTRQEAVDLALLEESQNIREDVGSDQDSGGRIALHWGAVNDPRSVEAREAVVSGERGYPWCAAFVSWLFEQLGYPLGPGFGYVPYLKDWLEERGFWRPRAYVPDPGDLVIFSERGERPDHAGIAVEVEDPFIVTVEGNLSNGLRSRRIRLDSGAIIGYGVILHE